MSTVLFTAARKRNTFVYLCLFRAIPSNSLPAHAIVSPLLLLHRWKTPPEPAGPAPCSYGDVLMLALVEATAGRRGVVDEEHGAAGPRGSPRPTAARRPEKGDVDGEARLEVDGSAGASLQSLCGCPRHSLLLTSRFQGPPPPPPKRSKAKP